MKKTLTAIATAIALSVSFGSVQADQMPTGIGYSTCGDCSNTCCDSCCDDCCGHWFADLELTFLRFYDSEGFRADDVFGFECAPRLTVGYIGSNGIGGRIRWWSYDHAGTDQNPTLAVGVDTYNLDFEAFTNFEINCRIGLEVSAGLRVNSFEYDYGGDFGDFDGFGGVFGAKATYATSECSDLYVRALWAILMGDDPESDYGQFDVVRYQSEIGIGYEHSWQIFCNSVLTTRIGAEWQNWDEYTTANQNSVGFAGFVLGLGLAY